MKKGCIEQRVLRAQDLFLTSMGEYYLDLMKDSKQLVACGGEHFRLSAASGGKPCELFCSSELAACRVLAIHETDRDWLDFRWRWAWHNLWVEFVKEWNKAGIFASLPGYRTIRAYKIPNTEGVSDERQKPWMFAHTAYEEAVADIPVIEKTFSDWYRKKVAEAGYDVRLSFSGKVEDGKTFAVNASMNRISREKLDGNGLPTPDAQFVEREELLASVSVPLTALMEASPDEIVKMARKECAAMDRRMRDVHGNKWPSERYYYPDYVSVDKFNEKCGYTGEPDAPNASDAAAFRSQEDAAPQAQGM